MDGIKQRGCPQCLKQPVVGSLTRDWIERFEVSCFGMTGWSFKSPSHAILDWNEKVQIVHEAREAVAVADPEKNATDAARGTSGFEWL